MGAHHVEKLRLRGLDCPEMSCDEGKAAKRFTESRVVPGQSVVIHTTKPDKYDRYLADVFVHAEPNPQPETFSVPRVTADGAFLNNALLEHGHAARKDEWEFGDLGLE